MPTKSKKNKKSLSNLPKLLFLKPKPIKVVTKKVLENIADSIYNPKNQHFLNLCNGTLQNGPDPVCQKRPMHCGLGELYFVVTGKQPEVAGVNEDGVIYEVTERSTIGEWEKEYKKNTEKARQMIKALNLPEDLVDALLENVNDHCFENEKEDDFRTILGNIPTDNDQGAEDADAKPADFKARAQRVASKLRAAAALLPR